MYEKDERAESFASWMIAGGARLDPPDPRHLSHVLALRDARSDTARPSSLLPRLAALLGLTTLLAAGPTTTSSATTCCAPA